MFQRSCQRVAVVVMLASLVSGPAAAALTADEIITQAYQVNGGRDGASRLTFTFQKPALPEKKLVYTMVWKAYGGKDGVEAKLLFFSEFPLDDRGKAFMAWTYTDRMDDNWIYLPELRMVRKVTHDPDERHRAADDFANSDLTRGDMVPRKPAADQHRLVGEDTHEGRGYYVVESIPKSADAAFPYSKTMKWISKDNFLTEQIDYYRGGDKPEKSETIKWKKLGDAWVWEQVAAENLKSGSHTRLTVSDIRINLGLKDDVFSARSLRNGLESVLR